MTATTSTARTTPISAQPDLDPPVSDVAVAATAPYAV